MHLYLAYGSNLHPERLRDRLGAVSMVGTARLSDARIAFNKVGLDGSGKCNLIFNVPGSDVFGAVYTLSLDQFARLDEFESRGRGYERRALEIFLNDGSATAQTYVAMPDHLDDALAPFDWYLELVVAGARHLCLPPEHVAALMSTPAKPDPDPARSRKWQRFASGLPGPPAASPPEKTRCNRSPL